MLVAGALVLVVAVLAVVVVVFRPDEVARPAKAGADFVAAAVGVIVVVLVVLGPSAE